MAGGKVVGGLTFIFAAACTDAALAESIAVGIVTGVAATAGFYASVTGALLATRPDPIENKDNGSNKPITKICCMIGAGTALSIWGGYKASTAMFVEKQPSESSIAQTSITNTMDEYEKNKNNDYILTAQTLKLVA